MRIVNRDISVRDASCGLSDRQTRNNNNNQHQGGCSFLSNSLNCNCKNNYNSDNSNQSTTKLKSSSSTSSTGSSSSNASSTSTSSKAAVTRICPHHVTLPDSECRYDRDLQIRAPYQVGIFFLNNIFAYKFTIGGMGVMDQSVCDFTSLQAVSGSKSNLFWNDSFCNSSISHCWVRV